MTSPPVLILADRPELHARLTRLASAAGLPGETAAGAAADEDPEHLAARWVAATIVVLDGDRAASDLLRRLPRRPGVHVVLDAAPGPEDFRNALAIGAEQILELPEAEGRLIGLLGEAVEPEPATGLIVGVTGGAGGAGASVFAAALATLASRAGPAVLVDADRRGPGADRLLGMDSVPGVRWDGLALSAGRIRGRALREALPSRRGLSVLSWSREALEPVDPGTLGAALDGAARGFGTVVVDLPRAGAEPLVREVRGRCAALLVLTTSGVPSVVSTIRLIDRIEPLRPAVVVRELPGGVRRPDLADALGPRVAAVMRPQRGTDEAIALGLGVLRSRRGPLARTAREVLAGIGRGGEAGDTGGRG